jgi:hypothetical protein
MIILIKKIAPPQLRHFLQFLKNLLTWHQRNYDVPSPSLIKQRVLLRNAIPAGIWVETGTYLGDTTHFLAKRFGKVISIEPEPSLFAQAKKRFSRTPQVEIINGSSETVFPGLLPKLSGNINFWLDGHYSGGTTWATYKGSSDTPITMELSQIEQNLGKFKKVAVLVDDVRCFQSSDPTSGYPTIDFLVDWARRTGLNWHIEHDIFVAKSLESKSSGS